MKRRNALILFGVMLAAVLAYAGWCARYFVKRPALSISFDTPADARAAIEAWHSSQRHFHYEAFSWRRYLYRLQYPWQDYPSTPIIVVPIHEGTGGFIYAWHDSSPLCQEFHKIGGSWRVAAMTPGVEIRLREEEFARVYEAAKKRFLNRARHGVLEF